LAPQATGTRQEIEVIHVLEGTVKTRESKTCLEKRHIERRAVVRNHKFETLKQFFDGKQHGWFFIEVAHEVLHHVECVAFEVTEPDHERNHPRTALNACGLSIEKHKGIPGGSVSPGLHHTHESLQVSTGKTSKTDIAMIVIAFVRIANEEMTSKSGDLFFT